MWLKKLSPKSWALSVSLTGPLISLFNEPGRWIDLVYPQECLTPQGDTLRSSIMLPFPIGGHNMSTIPKGELAGWLVRCGGLTLDRVPRIKAYVAHLLSKEAYNPTASKGQQWMQKAVTWASKLAHTKASTMMVKADQLDQVLASTRPLSPPQDHACQQHDIETMAWLFQTI
jgi:hypothetical protein